MVTGPNLKRYFRTCYFLVLIAMLAAAGSALGQGSIVSFAQSGVSRALNYVQGDSKSLVDAKDDFTSAGWIEFMKRMDGWLDEKGAPKGSSLFTSTGDVVVKSAASGETRVIISGVLKQETKNAYGGISTTTYRIVADVLVGGSPLKILHLETRTCGGATTAASCQ